MPWSNFAHLTAPPKGDEIGIKGAGSIHRSVPFAAAGEQLLPLKAELAAGHSAKTPPAAMTAFTRTQAARVRHYQVDPNFWLPAWVREHIDAKGKPDELIQKVIDRVKASPSARSLQEAQAVLNELGRSAEGTAAVRKALTKDVLRRVVQGGQ
ncbi:hypothetical protein [Acidipila rosea]|uniref:Uncharacterized protein n=1 Tax=Acidipila rosea TaxID=768535 RepID=A0A4R1L9N9_9BACT|nr:hypothetical protein [Acidipila rosea]TCK75045.1 hypothetical protein C7378_0024 [Acidipila rosea]